jgi:predicted phosphohydrolase
MDIFGPGWSGHAEKIEAEWRALISSDDYILMPGDFSWATYLDGALPDFKFLDSLPGKKILSKGNHDYWWTSLTKMKSFIALHDLKTIEFLHTDAVIIDRSIGVAASRGWTVPGAPDFDAHDTKLYERELIRIQLSFEALKRRIMGERRTTGNRRVRESRIAERRSVGRYTDECTGERRANDRRAADRRGAAGTGSESCTGDAGSTVSRAVDLKAIILMLHFPPLTQKIRETGFTGIIREYKPDICVYGHLHSSAIGYAYEGAQDGTDYKLISSDHLKFKPLLLIK